MHKSQSSNPYCIKLTFERLQPLLHHSPFVQGYHTSTQTTIHQWQRSCSTRRAICKSIVSIHPIAFIILTVVTAFAIRSIILGSSIMLRISVVTKPPMYRGMRASVMDTKESMFVSYRNSVEIGVLVVKYVHHLYRCFRIPRTLEVEVHVSALVGFCF